MAVSSLVEMFIATTRSVLLETTEYAQLLVGEEPMTTDVFGDWKSLRFSENNVGEPSSKRRRL